MGDIQKILNICGNHEFLSYYVYRNIPAKKLNNAMLNFPIPLADEVIALVDSTIFGSCKTGLAICSSGVYWKNDYLTQSKENYLSWKKFKKAQILHNAKVGSLEHVQIGAGNYFSTIHKVEVAKLLKDLQNNLKGDFFENAESFFDNADKKVNQVNGFVGKALSFLDNLGTTLEELADKIPGENNMIEVKDYQELADDSTPYVAIEAASEEYVCPPPIPQEEKWHLAINGQQEGPYDISTIKSLITERNINKTKCLVWKKGMANWSLMGEVDEFKKIFNDFEDMTPPPLPPIV